MKFTDLGLNSNVLNAITSLGFTEPTEIQKKSIPVLLKDSQDYIGLAQTGTGKTAAFGLPLINLINTDVNAIQALVLAPTRELCLQITTELKKYGQHTPGLSIVPVYGGADIKKQINELKRGAHIVVGTPGRLLDHIERRTIKLNTVERVILDEADEMLNMGFKDDIDRILSQTTAKKATWLFSATMPERVEAIAKTYMTTPVTITVGSKNSSAQNISHGYAVVTRADRYNALRRFVDFYPNLFGIVFCRTRHETKELVEKLTKDGYNADALHGDLSQTQRDMVMRKFRYKKLSLLVATDVAARGIDVSDVTHVFHYELPDDVENYTHRSGRTARAGKYGISLCILTNRDVRRIKYIERLINKTIEYTRVPDGAAICKNQLKHSINTIAQAPVHENILNTYIDSALDALKDLTKEDLIKRCLSREFNAFATHYNNAPDLNADPTPSGYTSMAPRRGGRGGRGGSGGRSRSRDGRSFGGGNGNSRGGGRSRGGRSNGSNSSNSRFRDR